MVSYTYDELDRVEEVSYYNNSTGESMRYGYLYSSDGSLSGITKDGVPAYAYEYDSLGRLIHSSMLEDGRIVLYTDHSYDTSDRILSLRWSSFFVTLIVKKYRINIDFFFRMESDIHLKNVDGYDYNIHTRNR